MEFDVLTAGGNEATISPHNVLANFIPVSTAPVSASGKRCPHCAARYRGTVSGLRKGDAANDGSGEDAANGKSLPEAPARGLKVLELLDAGNQVEAPG